MQIKSFYITCFSSIYLFNSAMTIYRCNLIIKNENIKNRTIKRDNSGRRNVLIVTIIIWTSMAKFLKLFNIS